ncbi:MAG: T9SS type A sorting domain-containing protein [Segetibacter sp.]|nr:T9SS type A sorting domain-containing protein [Segetibacter sp.]
MNGNRIRCSSLPPGSYFVQLLNDGKVSTLKFVKQR